MKKTLYLLTAVAFLFAFSSCSKKDGSGDLPHPEDHSGALTVPSNFGRKILVEEYTGAWCGYCPAGTFYFDSLDRRYPGKLVGVSIHLTDVMTVPELTASGGNALGDFFQVSGVPSGTVNRGVVNSPSNWLGAVPAELGLFAKCGFYIDASSVSGNSLTVTVHTGFAANLYGDYRLNVWIVETDVHSATDPDYDQVNFYSEFSSSPDPTYPMSYYYNLSDPINDFHHENVLRKLLTSVPFGDAIPQNKMVKGNDYIKTFSADLTNMVKANTYVVVFVDKYAPSPTVVAQTPLHQVQNAQKVKVGSVQGWN